MYRLLGGLLAAPASAVLIDALAALDDQALAAANDERLRAAWQALKRAAVAATPTSVEDEFNALFIGVSRGELVPYGSWYQTGLLMSQPLARLRRDLAMLGLERAADVHEPEDHVSCLCESMGLIIEDTGAIPHEVVGRFFADHVSRWMGRFFLDLQHAKAARFYAPVGMLGERFLALEEEYLVHSA